MDTSVDWKHLEERQKEEVISFLIRQNMRLKDQNKKLKEKYEKLLYFLDKKED